MNQIFGCFTFELGLEREYISEADLHPFLKFPRRKKSDTCIFDEQNKIVPFYEEGSFSVVSSSRIDNRKQLCEVLKVSKTDPNIANDSFLIHKAFSLWGHNCVKHLDGDWTFAVWNSSNKELFLSSDPMGLRTVHFFKTKHSFSFSSSLKNLISDNPISLQLNDDYIFAHLTAKSNHTPETIYKGVFALPSGTNLIVDHLGNVTQNRYYKLEKIRPILLENRAAYTDELVRLLNKAIIKRLPNKGTVGADLSGGLDSSAVSALTAIELNKKGKKLSAFTSVPITDVSELDSNFMFCDESKLAKSTASLYNNIDHKLINSKNVSLLSSLKTSLAINSQPVHAGSNAYWMNDIFSQAQAQNITTYLTGQAGNLTISWFGEKTVTKRAFNLIRWCKAKYRHLFTNTSVFHPLTNLQFYSDYVAIKTNASNLDYKKYTSEFPGIGKRCTILQPHMAKGVNQQNISLYYNFNYLDPTKDKELVEFCLSIPDHYYKDNEWDRLIIRHAMKNFVPKDVLWNKKRGKQAADIHQRIIIEQAAFFELIQSFYGSFLISKYIDLKKTKDYLISITEQEKKFMFAKSAHLLRTLQLGIFLQNFEKQQTLGENKYETMPIGLD